MYAKLKMRVYSRIQSPLYIFGLILLFMLAVLWLRRMSTVKTYKGGQSDSVETLLDVKVKDIEEVRILKRWKEIKKIYHYFMSRKYSSLGNMIVYIFLRLDFHLLEIFRCRQFSLGFFSIVSDHAELSYSNAQVSKESMRNFLPANNFSGSGNQPLGLSCLQSISGHFWKRGCQVCFE